MFRVEMRSGGMHVQSVQTEAGKTSSIRQYAAEAWTFVVAPGDVRISDQLYVHLVGDTASRCSWTLVDAKFRDANTIGELYNWQRYER
jgi:hypothetical protein